MEYFLLAGAAFFAAMIDAIVGGGGLIQVPALFTILPQQLPATLLGTNKLAGIFGTGAASINYARQVKLAWSVAIPASIAALIFAFAGAYTVTHVPADFLRRLLPFILLAVGVYTFAKKDFGTVHAPHLSGEREKWIAFGIGAAIGFYDGFFGPGTGSFLVFIFVRIFAFDFLAASAVAKIVNVACNLAALTWFSYSGHVLWEIGLVMAACQIAGSMVGSRLAIKHGSGFVRKLFLIVVAALICKTAYDAFFDIIVKILR